MMYVIQGKARRPMKIAFLRGAALLAGLAGCAPIAWQTPPGMPPQALAMDDAGCRLTARGLDPGYNGPRYGRVGQVIGQEIGDAIVTAVAQRQDYVLCMESRGYVQAAAP